MKWTDDQRHVIEYRNRNILVSAAAGSGKTAVLVQRIMEKITGTNPIDVDQLLVVTFTKAAAAEMRERIGLALEAYMDQAKDEEEILNLQKQLTLIHHAQITTIDSFCLNVVRNHFGEIGLDPNFRIADTGEIKLLEKDVLDELFELNYCKDNNENFLKLVDAYGTKNGDAGVREMVESIYRASSSAPWPKEWVESLIGSYQAKTKDEFIQCEAMQNLVLYVKDLVAEQLEELERLLIIADSERGPKAYGETIKIDIEMLKEIDSCEDYDSLASFFSNIKFETIKRIKKDDDVLDSKKESVKNGRDEVKDTINGMKKKYFILDAEAILNQMNRMEPYVEELISLTLEYMDMLAESKGAKRIVDFSDVEHFALNILVDPVTKKATDTAKEFQTMIDEIMIDEYQDSNQVQEEILCAISQMENGNNNMFMVGDVKQSIYRFRLARPELFMEKYHSYSLEESKEQRIDLKQNFRSRKEVLEFTNDIFYKIMQADLGKVSYDQYAALYYGADYYPEANDNEAELLFLDAKDELLLGQEEYNLRQLEAELVADRILNLMDHKLVMDKETKAMRPIKYSDIVILFRSIRSFGPEFATVLENRGIPVHVETSTGYFSTMEVQTVLSFLKILDNPNQDIPMAAVLKSPMVGLDNEELAEIKVYDESRTFAENALTYCKEAEGKALRFFEIYAKLRKEVKDTPIHELVEHVYKETGYLNYVAALPAGERRFANLSMLLEKAIAYENTSYKGLFHFVRYIDSLQKYDVDFGEADVTGESANVVHIMTIHKSKGLEFPVVFVSGCGKKFNTQETSNQLVIHPDLKLGLTEKTVNPRVKRKCIIHEQIANQIAQENLGEELRVLYVALTRAKEKLIVTGILNDYASKLAKYKGETRDGKALSLSSRLKAENYLDWIIPAMMSYPDKYEPSPLPGEKLVLGEVARMESLKEEEEAVLKEISSVSDEAVNALSHSFEFKYPYAMEEKRKMKYSVSELKHASMEQKYAQAMEEAIIPDFAKHDFEPTIPRFMTEKGIDDAALGGETVVNRGALRGTAVHRVMEGLDFQKILESDIKANLLKFVEDELSRMRQKDFITEDMLELIQKNRIVSFLESDIAYRMALAQKNGNLFREKPFIMDHEGVLVQGIIDVFWLEEDRLVVLDYKTDYVSEGKELITRYQTQLDLYQDALGRAFAAENHTPMAGESYIYAFHLQEVIMI